MVRSMLDGVQIKGIHCAVPAAIKSLKDDGLFQSAEEEDRLIKSIGVKTRHIAPVDMCTSDLCQNAAQRLLTDLDWDPQTVDVLIFVTQSADYVVPSTACALQARMGLSSCMAFDINLGCSGYIYGLWTVATLLKSIVRSDRPARGLLLAGDLCTRRLMDGDKSTIPLFGDAGSATALEVDATSQPMFAVFGTDGLGAEHLIIRAGAIKESLLPPAVPFDQATQERLYAHSRLHLDGHEVFNFTLKCVPLLLEDILMHANRTREDIDYFVMHQANAFMLTHLMRKMNLPAHKTPVELEHYGNTSSASIPMAICSALATQVAAPLSFVLLGFGVGWSWGALQLSIGPIPEPKIEEI